MTEEKKTSIFGKMKKALLAENCSCCCNIKIVPENPSKTCSCCDPAESSDGKCDENCCDPAECCPGKSE
ncbi:MAG TPA: hypothetical protein O0X01_08170 [Methanocorpusculum sp.]|nr:hypothetical protein [Methanocorpusculum sp.]